MNKRITLRSRWALLLLPLLMAGSVLAQARPDVAGNTLPDEAAAPQREADPARLDVPPRPVVMARPDHDRFAQSVNLDRFRKLSVFDGGRAKILETLAQEQLDRIYGKSRWKDLETGVSYDPVFTLLDMVFNQSYYFDKPTIYVEVLALRRAMVSALPEPQQEIWLKRGRVTPLMLADAKTAEIVNGLEADMLMQKGLSQVRRAIMTFDRPEASLYMVSPRPGDDHWSHLLELNHNHATPGSATAAAPAAAVTNPQAADEVIETFRNLALAWQRTDADAVNASLDRLSDLIPSLNPETYPAAWLRDAEHVYNRTRKFTIGYVGYFLGAVALLIAFAAQRRWLIYTGVGLLLTGFAVHSLGIGVRAALSGRWPIHNQYESFIAIVWLAVLVGIVMMFAKRQWLYGAAAAALGAAALLFANTVDIPSREVGQVAGILATSRILYVHVNLVLASYGLIGLAFFVSLFYLFTYYFQNRTASRFAAAGLGNIDDTSDPTPGPQATLVDLDRAQIVVLQLAFWILGIGILLGAYWADHAWGRWWAWDPKETWALITWIIYLMVIHLRFTVKRRGLVTAWMSVVGFGVMLWTYWGVNLLLAGLHSYA